jgi:glycosyltransferase involved in cell wall biosynthesis
MTARATPVLVLSTLLGGDGPTGVEAHLQQISAAATERGWAVYLVTPYSGSRWIRAFYRPFKNVRREALAVFYRRCQAGSLRRQMRAILRRHPDSPVTLYAQCPLSAQAALRARTDAQSAAVAVAAVHYNVSEADEIVLRGWARPDGPWSRHLSAVERYTLPQLDRVAFVSDFMRRLVNGRLPSLSTVYQETLFNFAGDPAEGSSERSTGADLIAIGTLEARKNQAFLLQVLAECKALGKVYTLTVVGDGPDRPALEALSSSLGIQNQVIFLGFQRNAAELIPRHQILVHAATSENCPVIIAEALACGRPILAPAIGGIPEMFRDGIEGRYWNLDRPEEAAALLASLLDDRPRYHRTAAAARARYEEVFLNLRSRWLQFLVPADAAS